MRIMKRLALLAILVAASAFLYGQKPKPPVWQDLPLVEPQGTLQHTGAYTVANRAEIGWKKPKFVYNEAVATGRKEVKVVVVIYDPVIKSEGGKHLTEYLKAPDPVEYSHILANVIREASWGYINYKIVDVIRVNGFTKKVDGFRYTDETYMAARKSEKWQPATTSYRAVLEENNLMARIKREGITEVWLWGASGMHFDEFAMYIPNRYARFGPTDNEWLYRPYDIPPELGKTFWVMGFNYEVGADNMIHSYVHRIESMGALAFGEGIWDTTNKRDPWNVFSWLEQDHKGTPSMVGNCHVPPNGQSGYDYDNKRKVLSWADNWARYPDVSGAPREISSTEWGNSQFGFMKWILERIPKFSGYTTYGLNNWWVYIANTDEDLPEYKPQALDKFVLPRDYPAKP